MANPAGEDSANAAASVTAWPFAQLFDFDGEGETLDVVYDNDSISVTFDDDLTDSVTVAFDRSNAPRGATIHITISDTRLNLDPTGDDVWTLDTNHEDDADCSKQCTRCYCSQMLNMTSRRSDGVRGDSYGGSRI